jgi:hypothetical protein
MSTTRLVLRPALALLFLSTALATAGCGLGPTPDQDRSSAAATPTPSTPSASPAPSDSDTASTAPSDSPASASASATPSSAAPSASTPSASTPAAQASGSRTVQAEGVAFDLPAGWEEADLSNVTTIRGNEPAPAEERRWRIAVDAAYPTRPGTTPVATLTYLRTDPQSPPTAPVEDRRAAIRDWAEQTVASLEGRTGEAGGGSLLEGLGCAEGTMTPDAPPRTVAFGPDGAGQAILIRYRCTAFTDPSLGDVLGQRWITTDTEGRRIDLRLTGYAGYLEQVAGDPGMLEDIVASIRPAD